MKITSYPFLILASAIFVSSCATTIYPDDVNQKNFSNLRSGKPYSFKLKGGTVNKKMIFSNITSDSIIGYSTKDSIRIAVAKANIISSKDHSKAIRNKTATAIGAVGAAAIILSSTRATK